MAAGGSDGGEREELGAEHCAFLQSSLLIISQILVLEVIHLIITLKLALNSDLTSFLAEKELI